MNIDQYEFTKEMELSLADGKMSEKLGKMMLQLVDNGVSRVGGLYNDYNSSIIEEVKGLLVMALMEKFNRGKVLKDRGYLAYYFGVVRQTIYKIRERQLRQSGHKDLYGKNTIVRYLNDARSPVYRKTKMLYIGDVDFIDSEIYKTNTQEDEEDY